MQGFKTKMKSGQLMQNTNANIFSYTLIKSTDYLNNNTTMTHKHAIWKFHTNVSSSQLELPMGRNFNFGVHYYI